MKSFNKSIKIFRDWFIEKYPNFHFTVEPWKDDSAAHLKTYESSSYMKVWVHLDILPKGRKDQPSNYRSEKVNIIYVFEDIELLELTLSLLKVTAKFMVKDILKKVERGYVCLKSDLAGVCLRKRYFKKYKFKDGVKHEII